MDRIKQKIYDDIQEVESFTAKDAHPWDLTHDQIRDMLVIVRRLKTRLEVLDAEKENDI